jgi:hypothetical protein
MKEGCKTGRGVKTAESADVTAFLGIISLLKMHQLLFIASSNSKILTRESQRQTLAYSKVCP